MRKLYYTTSLTKEALYIFGDATFEKIDKDGEIFYRYCPKNEVEVKIISATVTNGDDGKEI